MSYSLFTFQFVFNVRAKIALSLVFLKR